jgi:hypothetical protein
LFTGGGGGCGFKSCQRHHLNQERPACAALWNRTPIRKSWQRNTRGHGRFYMGPLSATLSGRLRYLSLAFWPSRQARNAASACSRSSALLTLRRGCFGGSPPDGVLPLTSSTPCRRIRLRLLIRDQLTRPAKAKSPLRQARRVAAWVLLGCIWVS